MGEIQNLFISIVQTPALLVGLLAVLGLVLQKKKTTAVIQGGIKTFAGFLILTGGAGILCASLDPFAKMFQFALNVQGVVPSNEAVVAIALVQYGSITALIMFVGMMVNILLARFTRFKYIFLTGQAMLYVSCLTAVILVSAGMGSGITTILLGGIFEGTLLTITPALCQPYMRVITGGDSVAMGHTGNIGYALSGWFGEHFGNKEHSTEDIDVPEKPVLPARFYGIDNDRHGHCLSDPCDHDGQDLRRNRTEPWLQLSHLCNCPGRYLCCRLRGRPAGRPHDLGRDRTGIPGHCHETRTELQACS